MVENLHGENQRMKRKIIDASSLLKRVMWEKLKHISLKGTVKAYWKILDEKNSERR